MRNPKKSESAAEDRHAKLGSGPRQYVDVNDLRSMLKLGLGLHAMGHPRKRWDKAADGMARLADAEAWVAMVMKPQAKAAGVCLVLVGGKDIELGRAAVSRIESEWHRAGTGVAKLIAGAKRRAGRVQAAIEEPNDSHRDHAVDTLLWPEKTGVALPSATWISIYRREAAMPFAERERRMVELFHSQSAWLLLQIAPASVP